MQLSAVRNIFIVKTQLSSIFTNDLNRFFFSKMFIVTDLVSLKIRNRYNQVPHLTKDTTWESDKTLEKITYKRVKRSALSQQMVKTAINRQDSMTDTKHKYQKESTKEACLRMVSKSIYWGL